MLISTDKETKQNPFFAIIDAKIDSETNIVSYSQDQVNAATEFHGNVSNAYFRSAVYLNFRKNFISVKVEKPTKVDKISNEVIELDEFCQINNIQKQVMKNGTVIYHLPK